MTGADPSRGHAPGLRHGVTHSHLRWVRAMARRGIVHIFRAEASLSRALERRCEAEVIRLCRKGRAHAGRAEHAEAVSCFLEAWELLPEPKEAWDASAYVLAGVGDLLRSGGDPFATRRRRGLHLAPAAV